VVTYDTFCGGFTGILLSCFSVVALMAYIMKAQSAERFTTTGAEALQV